MARKNWEKMDDPEAFAASVAPKAQRLWQGALGVVVLAALGFAVGWYVPLHRAHEALNAQYEKTASSAGTSKEKLTATLSVLEDVTAERDELRAAEKQRDDARERRENTIEKLEPAVASAVKKYSDKGWLDVKRSGTRLTIRFTSPVLQRDKAVSLTRAGRTVLCKALEPFKKKPPVVVTLVGVATDAQAASPLLKDYSSAFEVGAARAAKAASDGSRCGLQGVDVRVSAERAEGDPKETLRVEVQAAADAEKPASKPDSGAAAPKP